MNIRTKFNIGDTIYTVKDCKIIAIVIAKFFIHVSSNGTTISYHDDAIYGESVDEEVAFPSREELLETLKNS